MAVAELVSAEQYLHTSFEHDAEFVEGRIVERPVPTWEHAFLQTFLSGNCGQPTAAFSVLR
jgi:EAL domain-containing protein (putative c-di-GMP-specific phosphodiesterase class I)